MRWAVSPHLIKLHPASPRRRWPRRSPSRSLPATATRSRARRPARRPPPADRRCFWTPPVARCAPLGTPYVCDFRSLLIAHGDEGACAGMHTWFKVRSWESPATCCVACHWHYLHVDWLHPHAAEHQGSRAYARTRSHLHTHQGFTGHIHLRTAAQQRPPHAPPVLQSRLHTSSACWYAASYTTHPHRRARELCNSCQPWL